MQLSSPTHRALLVEDNPADARLVQELLNESGDRFELTVANRLSSALELLTREQYAVVLVDLGLPDASRMEALDALRAQIGTTPVVVYSGYADDTVADQARRLGVTDVLRKGSMDGPTLAAALRTIVDGAAFEEAVQAKLRTAKAVGADVAVIRLVTETMPPLDRQHDGRAPALQRAVAERFSARLGPEDGLFDLGDSRYGVVADVGGGPAGAARLADELERALDRPVTLPEGSVQLAVRTGSAFAGAGRGTAGDLLSRASSALRVSGTLPKALPTPHSHAPTLRPRAVGGSSFSARLRHAIQADELVLHYQPIVQLGDDNITVVEALVRWDDPVRGLLFPGDFIPQAEETSLIEEIGAWALMAACRQLKAWDSQGVAPVRCAVNLSARELCSASLPARVADALAATGLPPERLEVELTESMFADPDGAAHMIGRLRAIGVRVAIDDFGTGYSSLAYLTRLSVDAVKLDGGFIRRASEDPDAAAVVKAIVGIAHQLDLKVVAEGVETVEQLAFVREQGCDLVQGWLFCEAMPGPAAAEWLDWARRRVTDRAVERGALQTPPAPGHVPAVSAAPAPGASKPVGGITGGARRSPARVKIDRAVMVATCAAGSVLGALLAFPAEIPAEASCPPAGEGQAMCFFQKGYLPSILIFLACVLGAMLVVDLAYRMPGRVRARRVQREHDARRRAETTARRARLEDAKRSSGRTSGGSVAPLLLAESYEAARKRVAA